MGKGKKKNSKVSPGPRNIVSIDKVLGSANFGDNHREDGRHHLRSVVRPAQLPPRDQDFRGREKTIEELTSELEKGGGVALTGQPGVGKTALAIELAYRLLPRFPDAQLYVDMSNVDDGQSGIDRALERVLRALGFSGDEIEQDVDGKVGQYRSAVSGRRCLVVLDNVKTEHMARCLIATGSASLTIVTSRNRLSGLTAVRRVLVEQLNLRDSLEVITRVVGIERVNAEPAEAEEIAKLCAGIPLALRIAANRLRDREMWPLSHYADQLRDERRRLEVLRAGDLEVRASFLLSYSGLEPESRKMFRLLGVLPPSAFSVDALAILYGGESNAVETGLEALSDANLVTPDRNPNRFHLHDLLRAFARERLVEEESEEEVRALTRLLISFYFVLSSEADKALFDSSRKSLFASPVQATDWLETEHAALVHVVDLAYSEKLYSYAAGCAWNAERFLERRLHGDSWRRTSRIALQAARDSGDRKALLQALISVVRCTAKFPSSEVSIIALLDEARDLASELGSLSYKAQVAYQLGRVAAKSGPHGDGDAEQLFRSAAEMARRSKSHHVEGNALSALGDILAQNGNLEEAEEIFRRARFLYHVRRDRHCTGNAWKDIGRIRKKLGDFSGAVHFHRLALNCYQYVHDVHCAGLSLLDLADAYRRMGDAVQEREACQDAFSYFVSLKDDDCLPEALGRLARLDAADGDYSSAIDRYSQAAAILESGSRRRYVRQLKILAETVQLARGVEEAEAYWARAITASQGIPVLEREVRRETAPAA